MERFDADELKDKESVAETLRVWADASEEFKEKVFDVGVAEIAEKYREMAEQFVRR